MTSQELLKNIVERHGFIVDKRSPEVKPEHPGKWMVVDAMGGEDCFAIVGDDLTSLLQEAVELNGIDIHKSTIGSEIPAGNEHIHSRIGFAMLVNEVTLPALNELSGIPSPILTIYIQGKAQPSLRNVENIASALLVSPAWLAFGIGKMTAEQ